MRPSLPKPLEERLTRQYGSATFRSILHAFSVKRLPTLRVNTLKISQENVMAVFRDDAIAFERVKDIPHAFRIKNRSDEELLRHPLATEGKIYLQGISSMIPPLVLDPKPGETVLDLCAAPGSKTSQMAAMMNNVGKILACEYNNVRFQKLLNTICTQGANVDAQNVDATLLHKTYAEHFDKVLADVPCSAEGRIDLHDPRSYKFWSQKNIVEHAKLQRRLLRSAVGCVKPGGILVYSTCTLAPEENEEMIAWLLREFPSMRLERPLVPLKNAKLLSHGSILLPSEEHEGLFVTKLKKSQ